VNFRVFLSGAHTEIRELAFGHTAIPPRFKVATGEGRLKVRKVRLRAADDRIHSGVPLLTGVFFHEAIRKSRNVGSGFAFIERARGLRCCGRGAAR
jgi:hypothetical protein